MFRRGTGLRVAAASSMIDRMPDDDAPEEALLNCAPAGGGDALSTKDRKPLSPTADSLPKRSVPRAALD